MAILLNGIFVARGAGTGGGGGGGTPGSTDIVIGGVAVVINGTAVKIG